MLADRRTLLEDIRRRDQSATPSGPGSDGLQDAEAEAEADVTRSQASQRSRLESGRALLRDALSYERPSRRMRIPQPPSDPEARTAQDHHPPLDLGDVGSHNIIPRSPRPEYMPTPPHTAGDISIRSPSHGVSPSLGTASLTPGFAPAHRHDRQNDISANHARNELLARLSAQIDDIDNASERERVADYRAEIDVMRNRSPAISTPEYREAEAAHLQSIEDRLEIIRSRRERHVDLSALPPLRRTSRSSPDVYPAERARANNNVDGLGDRERSFSPDDDQWETMLTTIPPDERVPSTHSSFTSATASSSSLSSNTVSSYGTLVTAPSTSTDMETCPVEFDDSDYDPIDVTDPQTSRSEGQARRIESLAQRLNNHQYRDARIARDRRMFERQQNLWQLEADLARLERQIEAEQFRYSAAAGQQRRDARTGRQRL